MATLNISAFATSVSNQVAAIQTQTSALISFTTGSILRAVVNANAAVGMWLQGLALQVMALSRFATSYGSDADSWGLDWGFFRADATYSTGYITYSRFTSGTASTAFIPVGALVQTADKTQQFSVIADLTNPAYVAGPPAGYNLLSGVSSITVMAQSVSAAYAANVGAGLISSIVTSIDNVDTVTNSLPFTGGADEELDASYKARFPNYLQSLARGTPAAITDAIQALQAGTEVTILENTLYGGGTQNGYLTIIVDDGSGSPSDTFINNAATAANTYRAGSIQIGVFGPSVITVNVSFTIATGDLPSTAHAAAVTTAETAVITFINDLPDGATLDFTELYQVIWDSGPGIITDVTALLVNGGTSDLVPVWVYDVYKAGAVTGS